MRNNRYIGLFEKYLRNDVSKAEEQLLAEMLREDRQIHSLLENGLANADASMDEEISNRIYGRIHTSIHPKKKPLLAHPVWKKSLRWAAILILPIISAFSVYLLMDNTPENRTPVTVTAGNGEKAEITLADGSRVWLNSGSTLAYNETFNRKERNVYLTGEAYFEVAKDQKRPFTVKTKEMDIQALGTAFNVSAYDAGQFFSSVLLEGRVKVSAHGQEFILEENQRAIYDKENNILSTDKVYASDFVEWKNGNLYFQNQSFEEIANTLARVFNVEIGFVSEELCPIRFTGTLGGSSIRNTLDILSLTSPMRYEMNGTAIELYYEE
ncbi:MAG: iron dicitrate transport regulator FecR [Bacteroidia bacterium 44-10]|nr:MAG: iron dicitrate transport regulator FecR [Bacteroidia bacterium 44-10]